MTESNSPTREEVNAKLEAVEARLDGKLASIEGKIDRIGDQMVAFNAITTERFKNLSDGVTQARDAARRAETSASNVKWHIFFTALGVAGLVFVMWQVWAQGVEMVAGLLGPESTLGDAE